MYVVKMKVSRVSQKSTHIYELLDDAVRLLKSVRGMSRSGMKQVMV